MKLHILPSSKGDCLVLEAASGHCMLVDGGMSNSMRAYGRDAIAEIVADRPLDAIYVSHVDDDHISGVLEFLRGALDWKVYDFHVANGENVRAPKFPRPPVIKNLWHNAFRDQIGKNAGAVEDLIAAAAPALLASGEASVMLYGAELAEIAQSVPQAIEVSQLVSEELLDIPVNRIPGPHPDGELLMVRDGQSAFPVGSLRLTIVGPTAAELRNLRDGWNNWLREFREPVAKLRATLRARIDAFSESALSGSPLELGDWNGIANYKNVTAPNVASLLFMVEEDGRRLLLTGDAQQDHIFRGLKTHAFLDADEACHLDVLKIQHHGSEHNADKAFCRAVSADHYVFCGNGSHTNPELSVLKLFFESRCGAQSARAKAAPPDTPFTFWFSSGSRFPDMTPAQADHMKRVEDLVDRQIARSGGLMSATFNQGDLYLTLDLP